MVDVIEKAYGDRIGKLKEIIVSWIKRRLNEFGKSVSEERIEGFARAMATNLILSAEYGAGDAFAGYIIMRMARNANVKELMEKWKEQFEKLGVRNVRVAKSAGRFGWWMFWSDIMERADFGDEEMNNALRELKKMSASGGRYMPSWMKD